MIMNWLNLALRVKDAEIRYHRAEGSVDSFREALESLRAECEGELAALAAEDSPGDPEALESLPQSEEIPAPADLPPVEEKVAGYVSESWRSGV